MARLMYMSAKTVDMLRRSIDENITRYTEGDFRDLMGQDEWSIELGIEVDLSPLEHLDARGSAQADIENTKYVWQALGALKPSVACEEGIWARLTHVECLKYSRERWLSSKSNPEQVKQAVSTHFFARTLSMRRDDNAISSLWYNGFLASQVSESNNLDALEVILKTADVRLNLLQRSLTGSRPVLAGGIVRAAKAHPWITEKEENFRKFMVVLNRLGGGKMFEAMTSSEIDEFMFSCKERAKGVN